MMLTRDFTSWSCTGNVTHVCWGVNQGQIKSSILPDRRTQGHACSLSQQCGYAPERSGLSLTGGFRTALPLDSTQLSLKQTQVVQALPVSCSALLQSLPA